MNIFILSVTEGYEDDQSFTDLLAFKSYDKANEVANAFDEIAQYIDGRRNLFYLNSDTIFDKNQKLVEDMSEKLKLYFKKFQDTIGFDYDESIKYDAVFIVTEIEYEE